jgi:hypothetical protein
LSTKSIKKLNLYSFFAYRISAYRKRRGEHARAEVSEKGVKQRGGRGEERR